MEVLPSVCGCFSMDLSPTRAGGRAREETTAQSRTPPPAQRGGNLDKGTGALVGVAGVASVHRQDCRRPQQLHDPPQRQGGALVEISGESAGPSWGGIQRGADEARLSSSKNYKIFWRFRFVFPGKI